MARTSKRRAKCKKPRRKPVRLVYEDDQWVRGSKQIAELREKLIKEQNGIDPLTGEPLRKPVLDHCHLDGCCRGVLESFINMFEGRILKTWMKYCNDHTDTSLSVVLRNLADYLEKDWLNMPLHGAYVDDQAKFIKRCSIETICRRAKEEFGADLDKNLSKAELVAAYMQLFVEKAERREVIQEVK